MLHFLAVSIAFPILTCLPIVFFLVTKELFRELDPHLYHRISRAYDHARARCLHHYIGFRIWWLTCTTLTLLPLLSICRSISVIYARQLKSLSGKTLRVILYQC